MTKAETLKAYREKAAGARSVTIDLSVPIHVQGAEVKQLTLRRPTVGDLRRARATQGTDEDQEVTLAAALCELTPDQMDLLDVCDFDCVEAVIVGFRHGRVA